MDWRVLLTTFGLIFMAELGDKTQLAAIAMTARSRAPLPVFLGAVAALAGVTLIGVLCSEVVANLLPPAYVRKVAGVIFVAAGLLMLLVK